MSAESQGEGLHAGSRDQMGNDCGWIEAVAGARRQKHTYGYINRRPVGLPYCDPPILQAVLFERLLLPEVVRVTST